MTRVHPNANAVLAGSEPPAPLGGSAEALTVWRKSLLLNGKGFTVFDGKGDLVFRVDNYASEHRGEIVLMDAVGKPLLTLRRKKLSLGEQWLIYNGEEQSNPRFSVKKHVNLLPSKSLAHISHCNNDGGGSSSPCLSPKAESAPAFVVEGSYAQRCCTIYDDSWRQMAEIKRKESDGGVAFGLDVFRLVVQPGFDAAIAMAIVILLEQMFGSRASLLLLKG